MLGSNFVSKGLGIRSIFAIKPARVIIEQLVPKVGVLVRKLNCFLPFFGVFDFH